MLNSIIGLSQEQIEALTLNYIGDRSLSKDEFFYLAKLLGAHWKYDYEAAKNGKPGYHALLKSERHSDQFFVSKILLDKPNIREIIAGQLVRVFNRMNIPKPDWVAGIPDGATKLGEDVARIMGVKLAEMEKMGGKIELVTNIPIGKSLLLVEDFCTKGTGFKEAVSDIFIKCPGTIIYPYELVILNRGGLESINTEDGKSFAVVALVTEKIDDWDPGTEFCPPCEFGSMAVKPKVSDENWKLITTAQANIGQEDSLDAPIAPGIEESGDQ